MIISRSLSAYLPLDCLTKWLFTWVLGRVTPRSQSARSLNRETSALAKSIVLGDFWWESPGRVCWRLISHVKESCRSWPKLSATVWTQLCLCAPLKSTRRIVPGCQRSSSSSLPVAKRPLLLEISPYSRSLRIKLTASASTVVRCITKIRLRTCKIANHATGGERVRSFAGLLKQQGMAWLLFFTPTSFATSLLLQAKSTRHSSASCSPLTDCVCVDMDDDQAVCALRLRCIVVASFSIWQ